MHEYLLIFISTVLINNSVLVNFLGLCPFMGVTKKIETTIGMGLATTFVMTFASICSWIINYYILLPLDLVYLRAMSYILIIAVMVQFTEIVLHKNNPALYKMLGIFLPLITTNCAILGVPLLSINLNYTFLKAAFYGFSTSIGFLFTMILFSSMRERLTLADIPTPFKGSAIALVTAGLMALAFMGFNGLVKL